MDLHIRNGLRLTAHGVEAEASAAFILTGAPKWSAHVLAWESHAQTGQMTGSYGAHDILSSAVGPPQPNMVLTGTGSPTSYDITGNQNFMF